VGLGISRTNADSQWNPFYNTFHRNFCCGNGTIRQWFCKRDLDAANLRPALVQGCGKQTPSARKLFSRASLLYVPNVKMFCPEKEENADGENFSLRLLKRRELFAATAQERALLGDSLSKMFPCKIKGKLTSSLLNFFTKEKEKNGRWIHEGDGMQSVTEW